MPYLPEIPYSYIEHPNCQGAWLFTDVDEVSDISVSDASGKGNTGTFKGSGEPAWSTSVPNTHVENSVLFDTTDDVIDCGANESLDDIEKLTIVFWYKPGTLDTVYRRLVMKEATSGATLGFTLRPVKSSSAKGYISFVRGFDGQEGIWDSTNVVLVNNTWVHIAITYDRRSVSNDPIFYINGVSVSVTENKAPIGTAQSDASYSFKIGNRLDTRGANGNIAEVGVFDCILNADQIFDIYTNGLRQTELTTEHTQLAPIKGFGHNPFGNPSNEMSVDLPGFGDPVTQHTPAETVPTTTHTPVEA